MRSKIIILSARKWAMTADDGTSRTGISIQYINTEKLDPKLDSSTGEMGYMVAKQSIDVNEASKLLAVPGIYDATFDLRASGGKNILVVSDVDFVKALK